MNRFVVAGSAIRFLERIWLPVTLLLLATITLLSLLPLPQLPEVPGSDKTHHLVAYSALMLPAFFIKYEKRLLLSLGFFAWSGLIELVQPLVNRHGELTDLIANGAGLVIGALLGEFLSKLLIPRSAR